MSNPLFYLLPLLFSLLFVVPSPAQREQPDDDKTLSPYFLVKSDDDTDQLPLKQTDVQIAVSGVIADVEVQQTYVNTGKNPLEAIYVFPGSTRAAVYGMQMKIGERLLVAKIEEKQQARKNYEQAKEAGKSASLLEQQRPNVFQMNVANILPGDTLAVTLRYNELLVPEAGTYELVFPTVVGPRYSNTPEAEASADENWVANPYLHEGEPAPYRTTITTTIRAGMPISRVTSPSHDLTIQYPKEDQAVLHWPAEEQEGGNRDYIVRYQLAGRQIQSGLLVEEGAKENFFLLTMQPPERVEPAAIPPREYFFMLDVSGSMHGYPLTVAKTLMRKLVSELRPTDKFNILLFAASSEVYSSSPVPASSENLEDALKVIDRQRGGGGTELMSALQRAFATEKAAGVSRSFVVITDGYVTVEQEAFNLIRSNLGEANLFSFGIGSSVNRFLIEGMARAGMGEPFVATGKADAHREAERFRKYIQTPVLTDISVNFNGFEAYDVSPPSIPDVLAARPVIIYGKYKGKATGKITVSGISGESEYAQVFTASAATPTTTPSLRYLWARKRIAQLHDYNRLRQTDDQKQEITRLGLDYNLLTAYTSFVAIDSLARNEGGANATVKQPLPLPQGVSDNAVGNASVGRSATFSRHRNPGSPSAQHQEVADEETIQFAVPPTQQPPVSEEEVVDELFSTVEQQPKYPGGMQALYQYIGRQLKYPEEAERQGIEGRVFVQFMVDEQGNMSDFTVLKSVSEALDQEALRVLKSLPKAWNPGRQRGQPVKVRMVLPVVFTLSSGN